MFLLLASSACTRTMTAPVGFDLDLATAPETCFDDTRIIVVTALGNHYFSVNSETLDIRGLAPRLREILRHSAEKVVFVNAEPDATIGDFIELLGQVCPEAQVVSLLTTKVATLVRARYCGPAAGCGRCSNFL